MSIWEKKTFQLSVFNIGLAEIDSTSFKIMPYITLNNETQKKNKSFVKCYTFVNKHDDYYYYVTALARR